MEKVFELDFGMGSPTVPRTRPFASLVCLESMVRLSRCIKAKDLWQMNLCTMGLMTGYQLQCVHARKYHVCMYACLPNTRLLFRQDRLD